jgi:hypothetical protein
MRTTALAGLLLSALAATGAWAATPDVERVRGLATILQSGIPRLAAAADAPQLGGQVTALLESVKALVEEKSASRAAAKPVEDAAAALVEEIKRAPKPLGNAFCRAAADKVRTIAANALSLAPSAAAGARAGAIPPAGSPPSESEALAAFRKSAGNAAAIMNGTNFDGNSAPPTAAAQVPAPRPRPAIASIREPHTVTRARATLYGKWEGETTNRYGRPLCYVERYALGKCSQISISIDQRLQVKRGTRVESPELTAAYHEYCRNRKCARAEPVFGIDDTGGCKHFQGDGHVDVAASSNGSTFYRAVSRLDDGVSLTYLDGLPQDPNLVVTCGRKRRQR